MGLLNAVKSMIYKVDLLDSGSLLRIKGEPEHKTLLGGIVSLSLMLLLATAFWNKIVATFNKNIITSSTAVNNADDPLPFSFSTLPDGPFMLGVQILNYNLNGNTRHFDIELSSSDYHFGVLQNTTFYNLQPCTKEHWAGFPKVQNQYDNIGIFNWACFPKNKQFQVKGKYSSQYSKTLNIIVKKCLNNSYNDPRLCANQSQIDQLFSKNNGSLFYSIYFLNPIINPDSQNYIDYYLQDSNYIIFSQNGGEEARLFVQDYSIETDQSILPIQDITTESGGMITSNTVKSTFSSISDIYAAFYFFKAPSSSVYKRTFQKLDDVFSYIGGLFGTILILFFLISAYNTYKFQINIAGYLYHKQNRSQSAEKRYNFAYYIGQLIYTTLKLLNFSPNWEKLSYYYETRQQILKQLDILLLMKRVNFLQKSLTYLFTDHQLKGLYLANHFTIQQAVSMRRKYKLKAKLKQQIKKNKNYCSDKEQYLKGSFAHNQFLRDNGNLNKTNEDSFIEEQSLLDHQFGSDHYSSESSSEDDDNMQIIQSLKLLSRQRNEKRVSQNIWRNIDKRVKILVQPILHKQYKKIEEIKEDFYEQIKINDFNPKQINAQQLYELPFCNHQLPQVQVQTEEKAIQYQKNIQNQTFAKFMFSKIQTVHPEMQNQTNNPIK